MNVRAMTPEDLPRLKEIHRRFFRDQFDFPDFVNGYLCAYLVEEDNEIIAACGIRTLAEAVLITNKSGDFSVAERREALLNILDASRFVCQKFGYDQLHAFVINDENWNRHLTDYGFNSTKGKALVLNL
jgi:hypothetical protein